MAAVVVDHLVRPLVQMADPVVEAVVIQIIQPEERATHHPHRHRKAIMAADL
jgi:hypothetical protein